ncbi:MAG: sulfatase [Deltaproteobacteria bacterium]|nr:MAG: sulfatase [Deltaproteobacteria bacterium]
MNVIWIVADTLRRDHIRAYGNNAIRTPALDSLAAKSVRFDNHYAAGFPTMPARADHMTGRWTMSFMGWEPLPESVTTVAQLLASKGFHTAAVVDTPFYLRDGMNYDRGFQTFHMTPGQEGSGAKALQRGYHESQDVRAAWRYESDYNAAQTFTKAMQWLENHYKEDFLLYVDTWDPHEPWDAPSYYAGLYWPDYDGEIIQPVYGKWHEASGFTEEKLRKAHATYCGEVTMVDTWLGFFLQRVENMGLMDRTAIIFTSDHGFYFGEHDGLFGKMVYEKRPDGTFPLLEDWDKLHEGGSWAYSPLYEELIRIPLLIYLPGLSPGIYRHLTSAVDLMPTVLDILHQEIPGFVEGESLLPRVRDPSLPGRDFVISTIPFANPGDPVRSVDNFLRMLAAPTVATITSGDWSLLYSTEAESPELYNLQSDPKQERNIISSRGELAKELHHYLVRFMQDTHVPDHLQKPRLKLHL